VVTLDVRPLLRRRGIACRDHLGGPTLRCGAPADLL